jgi:hypothetical protein
MVILFEKLSSFKIPELSKIAEKIFKQNLTKDKENVYFFFNKTRQSRKEEKKPLKSNLHLSIFS